MCLLGVCVLQCPSLKGFENTSVKVLHIVLAFLFLQKVWSIQRREEKKTEKTESVSEKDLMADLLDKDFNVTALETLKERMHFYLSKNKPKEILELKN